MGRTLMTPDELRRMDVNECIIFVKGLKPIKASKYYYFENPKMNNDLQKDTISHNNFDAGVRGVWRKYNPYNPYVPDNPNVKQENLKVESLDDLFEDDLSEEIKQEKAEKPEINIQNNLLEDDMLISDLTKEEPEKSEQKNDAVVEDFLDFDDFDSPVEAPEPLNEDDFTEDIQKELEAKFDELFGNIEGTESKQ